MLVCPSFPVPLAVAWQVESLHILAGVDLEVQLQLYLFLLEDMESLKPVFQRRGHLSRLSRGENVKKIWTNDIFHCVPQFRKKHSSESGFGLGLSRKTRVRGFACAFEKCESNILYFSLGTVS